MGHYSECYEREARIHLAKLRKRASWDLYFLLRLIGWIRKRIQGSGSHDYVRKLAKAVSEFDKEVVYWAHKYELQDPVQDRREHSDG